VNKLQLNVLITGVIAVLAITTGCANSASSQSFPRVTVRTGMVVEYGEVLSTSVVEIEGQATIVGRLGGAWVGRAVGLGNSRYYSGARRIQGAVGAVSGTVAGEAIERAARTSDGLQIVVQLDNDETIAIVQANDVEFEVGDRVQVLSSTDGSTRVQHP
jgi:outer membrane lipoprotein SlyB